MSGAEADVPFFFTWSAQRAARGFEIVGGEGVRVRTADGGSWLDLASLSYQASLGHGHPRMLRALREQVDSLCLAPPNADFPAKRRLAEELLRLAPRGFSKVFFTLGGAEATENALKIARLVTGRLKLVSRYRSYHGATMGALSLSGDHRRPPLEPGLPGIVRALDCYCDRCPFGQRVHSCRRECATHVAELIDLEGRETVAAVVLEAVPGANGVLVPPPDYLPLVARACRERGALLIMDEVLTGFGRTGRCFGYQHFGIEPDLITLGKALTGGYAPLGAVLVHERVARHFDDRTLWAGLTSYGHPLGCAAGLEALAVLRDEALAERAAALEAPLRAGLERIRARLGERAGAVRAIGALGALDLDVAPEVWGRLAAAVSARRLIVHLRPSGGHVIVSPPLAIAPAELEAGLDALGEALAAGVEEPPEA